MTKKTKKPRTPRATRKPRASTRRLRAAVPPAFEGKQAMIPGVEPTTREPEQPGDDVQTVQTLRVTRREVRRWQAAADESKKASGRSWERAHAMTWARDVLNKAAAAALGSAL